ncbi:hypothetical protein PHLCEN_2v10320 [Hermanssonia centrifuga]|uniref:FAD-binding oxidoreductase/transferase type 4 C-terminal domain-containing protein n=1 Tax=Hermanssonia centrifuga TaxID=98765 RepID=A0A2R6NN84_9APHY|nr:hypothetical protein PHLCEN_2v10320 [Hermanssonia centrifuga]
MWSGGSHTLLIFKTDEGWAVAKGLMHRMAKRATKLDGTCTGEHGVAMGEREYLYEELREGTVDPMKTVNKTIDPSPLNLVNPGKTGDCESWEAF